MVKNAVSQRHWALGARPLHHPHTDFPAALLPKFPRRPPLLTQSPHGPTRSLSPSPPGARSAGCLCKGPPSKHAGLCGPCGLRALLTSTPAAQQHPRAAPRRVASSRKQAGWLDPGLGWRTLLQAELLEGRDASCSSGALRGLARCPARNRASLNGQRWCLSE